VKVLRSQPFRIDHVAAQDVEGEREARVDAQVRSGRVGDVIGKTRGRATNG
jgi:hypothetical protein